MQDTQHEVDSCVFDSRELKPKPKKEETAVFRLDYLESDDTNAQEYCVLQQKHFPVTKVELSTFIAIYAGSSRSNSISHPEIVP